MDEQATFETQAVIGSRRAGWNRLAIVIPVLTLAAMVWVGANGGQSPQQVATATDAVAAVVPSPSLDTRGAPQYPTQTLGLKVKRLNEIDPLGLRRDEVVAISGWYETTAITGCPPLSDIYRPQPGAELNIAVDSWSYCDRFGVLYARDPLDPRPLLYHVVDGSMGLAAVDVTVTTGVVVPPALEKVGATAAPVVVLAHFVPSGKPCPVPISCPQELVVDHLAWAPGL
jgi:hypothetical protein